MGGINTGRWLLGGLVAGLFIFMFEGVSSVFYMEEMTVAMEAHNLSMDMSAGAMVFFATISLVSGLVLVFFYAAVRPRFGPGMKTAAIVAIGLWTGGYLMTLLGYWSMHLFPNGMLATWGLIGLVEMILATILGAWIYRED